MRQKWEADRVLEGKWSPVKVYRKKASVGVRGGSWALRLEMLERVPDEVSIEQRVYAIVTLRDVDSSNQNVYQEGVAAIARLHYGSRVLVSDANVRLDT